MNNRWVFRQAASAAIAGLLVIGGAQMVLAQKLVLAGGGGGGAAAAEAQPAAAENSEALQKLSRKLLSPADIQADKKPLARFAEDVARQYDIPLRVDEAALKAAGVGLDTPITAEIKKGTLGQALSKMLKEHKLRWEMRDTEIVITASAKVAAAKPQAAGGAGGAALTVPLAVPLAAPAEAPKVDPEMLQKISRKMLAAAEIQADKTQLSTLMADLSKKYEIPIRVDGRAILAAGLPVDPAITAKIDKGTLGRALTTVLKERGLKWELRDTEVVITSIAKGPAPAKAPAEQAAQARVQAAQARALAQAQAQEKALQQQEKQFIPQFRVLWKGELHLIRNICQPTDEQLTKLQAGGQAIAENASAQFVRGRNGGRRVVNGVVTVVKPTSNSVEPRAIIQDVALPVLEAHLKPEQIARYKDELDKARIERRDMVIENLVAKLDRDLQLSGEQREKLAASLATNWEPGWALPAQALMNLDNAFPSLPDKVVLPTLNERQQNIWRSSPKQHMQNYFGGFGLFGNQIDESSWDEEGASAELPMTEKLKAAFGAEAR